MINDADFVKYRYKDPFDMFMRKRYVIGLHAALHAGGDAVVLPFADICTPSTPDV